MKQPILKNKNTFSLCILFLIAFCTLSSAQITRTQIVNNALPYTSFSWTAYPSNCVSGGYYCSSVGRIVYSPTPSNSTQRGWVVVGTNTSMPYAWGGWATQSEHISHITNGSNTQAGDICGAGSIGGGCSGLDPGTPPFCSCWCASGHDCSGLVSRAWGLSSKQGTSTLSSYSSIINYSQLQSGDIINFPGSHTRLIRTYYSGNNSADVIEASGTDWKTSPRAYTPIQISGYDAMCPFPSVVIGGCGTAASLNCSNPTNLTCGQSYNGTTIGGSNNVSVYGCNSWVDSGPEKVHSITTTSVGDITASLSNLNGIDLDVWILGSCDPSNCLGSVLSNSSTYLNAPPGTYYIVVDGYLGASGTYTLNVTGNCTSCTDNFEPNPSCAQPTNVFGSPLGIGNSSHTPPGTNIGFSGDQDWYEVQLNSCGTLTITLSNLPLDYDIQLYGGGCPGALIDVSNNSGTIQDQIIYANNNSFLTTYFIYVHAKNGSDFSTSSCYDLNFSWTSSGCSSNDNCPGTTLSSNTSCINIAGDLAGATTSIPAINCGGGISNFPQDVWYNFTPISSGNYQIIVQPSSGLDAVLGLYSSGCSNPAIDCADVGGGAGNNETLNVALTGGQSYYLRVYHYGISQNASTTTFNICVTNQCATPSLVLVAGGGSICTTTTLNASGGSGGTMYWQGTNSNGTSFANPSTSQTVSTSGTYYFRAYNACGWGPEGSANVTINSVPTSSGISGTFSVCQNSNQVYTAQTNNATLYTWILPSDWSFISGQGSSTINVNVGTTSGQIYMTPSNGCGNGIQILINVTSTLLPPQPDPISGNNSVCLGSNINYTINSVSGATNYTWTLPSGWSGSSTSESISVIAGSNSGTISVTANNNCGGSSPSSLAISSSTISPPFLNPAYNITYGSFVIDWANVSGTTNYFIDVATDNAFSNFVSGYQNFDNGNMLSANISGLTCGTTYYFRVKASNGTCTSTYSLVSSAITVTCPTILPNLRCQSSNMNFSNNILSANVAIENNGTSSANNIEIQLALFTDSSLSSQYLLLGTQIIPLIASGSNSSTNITQFDLCSLGVLNGTYYLGYFIDQSNSVQELDESDNGWCDFSNSIQVSCCNQLLPPSSCSSNNITDSTFSANWNSSNGAISYYIDIATDSLFSNYLPGFQNQNMGSNLSLTITGLTCSTTYYWRVRSENGICLSINSGIVSTSTLPCACSMPIVANCTPQTLTYCCGMGITNFTVNTLSSTTGDGVDGYQDYTCIDSTMLRPSSNYQLLFTTGVTYAEKVRAWIDFNNNGMFDLPSEQIFSDSSLITHNGNFTVPNNAVSLQPLRLRISSDYATNQFVNPCSEPEFGQVEDYTVYIDIYNKVNSIQNSKTVDVFPNPTKGKLNIGFNREFKNCRIQIFNILSQEIYFEELINGQQSYIRELSLDCPSGTYLLKLIIDEDNCTKMFVVE